VNGLALASVITPLVAITATSGVAVWSARRSADLARESARHSTKLARESAAESAKLARETRVQQRLADSYLEVLRLVEREAQWFEASTKNWKVGAINYDQDDFQLPRVELPERTTSDRATIAAHLAAYGSTNVRKLHQTWRSTITSIEDVYESWDGNWAVNSEPPSVEHVEHVLTLLHPNERVAREALGDAIADELGHRSGQHCD
jgi:hypothetical protein